MRCVVVLAVALVAVACSGEDRPVSKTQPRETAAPSPPEEPRDDWVAQRTLSDRRADAFASREPAVPVGAEAKTAETAIVVPAAPAPPPFTYAGKVTRGAESYAVLASGDRVFVVRAGDRVGDQYRVQSISESLVVLLNLDLGITQTLAFTASAVANPTLPTATAGGSIDDVSLRLSAPSQVAVGEQFTLTVSLDAGMNGMLETGRVEVRFDPKVLEIPGQAQSRGAARVDIYGAYAGHPAPAMVQFRVVAESPTATEIRVVPMSIPDTEGRDIGVNAPPAHRLTIVRAATPAKSN
jgi:hypothetical protein